MLCRSMIQIVLLRFKFDRKTLKMSSKDANKITRQLFGYHSHSFYGKYHHWVNGLLDEIEGKRIGAGTILIPEKMFDQLKKFLECNNAMYEVTSNRIFMMEEDFLKIKSMGKELSTQKK